MITVLDGCDLGENLATKAMTNLDERATLGENRILKGKLKGLMLSDVARYSFRASSSGPPSL